MRFIHRFVPAFSMFAIALSFESSQATADAPRMHLLLAGATNDLDLGPHIKVDLENIKSLFMSNSVHPRDKSTLYKLNEESIRIISGTHLRRSEIVNWLQALRCDANDIVIVYFSGHGHFDAKNGHWLQFDDSGGNDSWILRADLVEELDKIKSRLRVLLTDCCANRIRVPMSFAAPAQERTTIELTAPQLVRSLFLNSSGLVDLTACSFDEIAISEVAVSEAKGNSGKPQFRGGVFTQSICTMFTGVGIERFDNNRDNEVDWMEFHDHVQRQTRVKSASLFKRAHDEQQDVPANQNDQTPHAFQLPYARFGVEVSTTPAAGGGLVIDEVFQPSPAFRAGLKKGDILLEINATPVADERSFVRLVGESRKRMATSIRRGENRLDIPVQLQW